MIISCKPNFTFVQLFWSGFSTTRRRNGKEERSVAWTRWVPPSAYNVALYSTWSLLCRITFLEYLLCWRFHHKLRLTSVKCVFSVCWDAHEVAISCSCGVEHSWSADVGHLCIPRTNPIWPWLWFFSCVVKFSLLPFYWRFFSPLCIKTTGLQVFFFFSWCLPWLWHYSNIDFI